MASRFRIDYENTPFLQTSETGALADRLNFRCEILLTRNQEAINGNRVLDLASHDGRFSYACLKLGASHVTGIEGRQHLVESAEKNLTDLGHNPNQFSFIQDDIFNYLHGVEPEYFDIVLCFGFLYHTVRQTELINEINRIQATYLLLDTLTVKDINDKPCLLFLPEDHNIEGATIESIDLVAWPTKAYIELVLKTYGFNFNELRWNDDDMKGLSQIGDYEAFMRASYFARRNE